MKVTAGGAEGSQSAMQITGEIVESPIAWAGAIFFPGAQPMAPANLSARKSISFWARGESRKYSVMVYSQSGGFIPKVQSFDAGAAWQKVTLSFSDFETDGNDITSIFFGACLTPAKCTLCIENEQ